MLVQEAALICLAECLRVIGDQCPHPYQPPLPPTALPFHSSTPCPLPPHPQALFVKYYDTVMPLLSSILVGATDKLHRLLRAKALECISLVAMVSSRGRGGILNPTWGGRQTLGAWGHGHSLDYIMYPPNNPSLLFRRPSARIGFARTHARSWGCCSSCRRQACWRRTTPPWAT